MFWKIVGKWDVRARLLADRHYSRQSPGAVMFTPPGHNIVLLGINDDALWVSHRIAPGAVAAGVKRQDGFAYWDNPYFRNESGNRASDMILEALAITLWAWGAASLPPDGFHSFVDPKRVKGVKRRKKKEHPDDKKYKVVYGWVFEEAGFEEHDERTKERDLIRWIMTSEKLRRIEPIEPIKEQHRLFA